MESKIITTRSCCACSCLSSFLFFPLSPFLQTSDFIQRFFLSRVTKTKTRQIGTVPNEKTFSKVFRNQTQTGLIGSSVIRKYEIKILWGKKDLKIMSDFESFWPKISLHQPSDCHNDNTQVYTPEEKKAMGKAIRYLADMDQSFNGRVRPRYR